MLNFSSMRFEILINSFWKSKKWLNILKRMIPMVTSAQRNGNPNVPKYYMRDFSGKHHIYLRSSTIIDIKCLVHSNLCIGINHYLPSNSKLLVNSKLLELTVLERPETSNVGCFGVGSVPVSLSSMVTTFDMVGRSFGSICTHKSPICTHFTNWSALQTSCSVGSIKSTTLFSPHNLHAWENFKLRIGMKHKITKTI
jgi:hypothetical protein